MHNFRFVFMAVDRFWSNCICLMRRIWLKFGFQFERILLLVLFHVAPAGGGASDVSAVAEAEGCGGGDSPQARRQTLGKLLLGGAPSKINITWLTRRCKGNLGCRAAVPSQKLQTFQYTSSSSISPGKLLRKDKEWEWEIWYWRRFCCFSYRQVRLERSSITVSCCVFYNIKTF